MQRIRDSRVHLVPTFDMDLCTRTCVFIEVLDLI
jgi:hypothetical protein